MNIAFLSITSWRGISIGAEHYYGRLSIPHLGLEDIEIRRPLSSEEIDILNEKDGYDSYEEGDTTIRFDSKQDIIDAGLELIRTQYSDVAVLFECKSYELDPCPILLGPFELITRGNAIYEKARSINFYEGDEPAMELLYKEWCRTLIEFGIER